MLLNHGRALFLNSRVITISNKILIKIEEYKESVEVTFDTEELNIIHEEFKNKIEVIPKSNERRTVKGKQYVGYIILPNHIINIEPKIKGINVFNMVKYAFDLLEIKEEDLPATENLNFYDILVSFFYTWLNH